MVDYDIILNIISVVLLFIILFIILFGCKGRRYRERFSNNNEEEKKEKFTNENLNNVINFVEYKKGVVDSS